MDAEKKFVAKYKINGEEYIGWIYASNIDQANDFLNQRRNTEEVIGGSCIDQDEINDVINHILCMGTYISIKSTVNAFRYGIDPVPEWFDKISNKTDEVDVMVDGNKVKALDIRLENGILRAFYGYYIGLYPDNSIQVFRPEDFHSLYTLKI